MNKDIQKIIGIIFIPRGGHNLKAMDKGLLSKAACYILSRPNESKALVNAIREGRKSGKPEKIKFTLPDTVENILKLKK